MGEGRVEVVRITDLEKHPNADALEIVNVHGGYPCIVKLGQFKVGDLAAYVPVDSLCPTDVPGFEFLGGPGEIVRIKAKRLRGIFSMGLLIPAPEGSPEGDDVTDVLRVTHYDPQPVWRTTGAPGGSFVSSNAVHVPFQWPVYDIEALRKHKSLFNDGEIVEITEKIHGCNSRYVVFDNQLWVGSRNQGKKEDESDLWWRIAKQFDLANKLAMIPGIVVYGEVFGQVQDLKYSRDGIDWRVFDMYDLNRERWLDLPELNTLCEELGLPRVPVLYYGPYSYDKCVELAEGQSTIGNNVREGVVVKPVINRYERGVGRLILKIHGQSYRLRKGG